MALPVEVIHSYLDAQLVAAFLELFLDGIYTTLVAFTLLVIVTSKRPHSFADYMIYLVLFILYGMAMIHIGSWTHHMRDAFINHTGPTTDIYAFLSHKDPQALGRNICAVGMTFFADLVLVWRVFALWGSNWKVGILPLLLTFVALAFGIQYIYLATVPGNLVSLSKINVDSGTYYGSTLANTVVSTFLILWRVHSIGGMKGVTRYWRFVGMVVESAALYSIILIIYMPFVTGTNFATHAATYIVQSVVIPITGIAPTLLVTRVLLNREKVFTVDGQEGPHPVLDSIRFMTMPGHAPARGGETTHINSQLQSRTLRGTVKGESKTQLPTSGSGSDSIEKIDV